MSRNRTRGRFRDRGPGRRAVVAGLALLALACRPEAVQVSPISAEALLTSLPGQLLILDVRTPEEFAAGRVPGATNVPHDELTARLGELPEDRSLPVVVYCKSGTRAGFASDILTGAGYTNVLHLEGDMDGWYAANQRVEVDEHAIGTVDNHAQ